MLAQHNEVIAVDIIPKKVKLINDILSPIKDEYIKKYFKKENLNLYATLDYENAYKDVDFVVIAHQQTMILIKTILIHQLLKMLSNK